MIRLPLALAAATLAVGIGSSYAQAQMPVAPTTPSLAQPAMPGVSGVAPMAPATHMTPPPPHHRMHGRPMGAGPHHRAHGRPMGAGRSAAPQQPPMTQAPIIADGMVQPPAQPFSNLNLPNTGVGDGAYGGGGMVLEYLPDGTRRIVQQ